MIDEHDEHTVSMELDSESVNQPVDMSSGLDTESVNETPKETAVMAPERDPTTGQFLPGNKGGGRPKGAKDKVSTKLVNLMTDLMESRGEELISRVADSDPAAALAILTRIVPQAELQRIFLDGTEDKAANNDIRITLINQVKDDALPHHDVPRLVEGEVVPSDTTH